jgi:hypothetical protein
MGRGYVEENVFLAAIVMRVREKNRIAREKKCHMALSSSALAIPC